MFIKSLLPVRVIDSMKMKYIFFQVSVKDFPYLTAGQMERRRPPFLRAAGKTRAEVHIVV